jgi:hypothetical protein
MPTPDCPATILLGLEAVKVKSVLICVVSAVSEYAFAVMPLFDVAADIPYIL